MTAGRRADYVICYDITEPRRLRRIHRYLRRWGVPLQYSVFYCQLNKREKKAIAARLREKIDSVTDDVRIYGIQGAGAVHYLGLSPFPDDVQVYGFHQVCIADLQQARPPFPS